MMGGLNGSVQSDAEPGLAIIEHISAVVAQVPGWLRYTSKKASAGSRVRHIRSDASCPGAAILAPVALSLPQRAPEAGQFTPTLQPGFSISALGASIPRSLIFACRSASKK